MRNHNSVGVFGLLIAVALVGQRARADDLPVTPPPPTAPAAAQSAGTSHDRPEHGSLAKIGVKLANPTSDVWALFTQFGLTFSDGNDNLGSSEIGGNIIFEPIMPVPLYGPAADPWKLIFRPTVPLLLGNPVPRAGLNNFDSQTGLGDILMPLPISPPKSIAGNWMLALGPAVLWPTSTKKAFGHRQFAMGPTALVGYKGEKWLAGIFPQYYFGIGSRGDQGNIPDASFMSIVYFAWLNLPDAWQIGFDPTINYDAKATKHNRWNVPLGFSVAKTTSIKGLPVKFEFGFEYSVVSQRDFGQRFQIKLNVIPVIKSLVQSPVFGGS